MSLSKIGEALQVVAGEAMDGTMQGSYRQSNTEGGHGEEGDALSDNAALLIAISAYRELLKEHTQERVPLDWAMTQNSLGDALKALGQRENGTARLEEAVRAYREALKEYTQERVPLDWAMTQNNLGNALRALGQRENGTARLKEAVRAYHKALKEMHPGAGAASMGIDGG